MRKLTAMALSMMFILGSVIPVGAEETQIRQTKISLSIDPVYTVTIPANTTIERGEQSVKLGSVSLDNARLEPDILWSNNDFIYLMMQSINICRNFGKIK